MINKNRIDKNSPKHTETQVFVEKQFIKLRKKRMTQILIIVSINILLFLITATLVVLNLFAIKKNPENDIKWLFVVLIVLSGIGSLISSIISIFVFKNKVPKLRDKIIRIKEIKKKYKKSIDQFDNPKNKKDIYVSQIVEIIEE
ncbi:MAG: hypothetical protein K4H23_05240 [Mollicutes bacterium PWAP]|nr:hypothetical protein [Mollicutes bacterium PWAP]